MTSLQYPTITAPTFPQHSLGPTHCLDLPQDPPKKPEEELWAKKKEVTSIISLARRCPSSNPATSAMLWQLQRQKSLLEAKHAPPSAIFSHFALFISQTGMKL